MKRKLIILFLILLITLIFSLCSCGESKIDNIIQQATNIINCKYPIPDKYSIDTGELLPYTIVIIVEFPSEWDGFHPPAPEGYLSARAIYSDGFEIYLHLNLKYSDNHVYYEFKYTLKDLEDSKCKFYWGTAP